MGNETDTGRQNPMAAVASVNRRDTRPQDRQPVEILLYSNPNLVFVAGQPPYLPEFTVADFEARNQGFVDILEDLRLFVQQHGVDLRGYDHNYLKRLSSHGLAAYNKIVSNDFRDTLAHIKEQKKKKLSLTFRSPPEMNFFWEMLYSGRPGGDVHPEQFWGFCYPIGRAYMLKDVLHPEEITLLNGIFSAIHDELPYSKPEIEQLKQFIKQVHISLGLQLELAHLDQKIAATALSCQDLMEYFIKEDFRYGIIHFACHCDNPQDAGASEASLIIKVRGRELEVRLKTLEEWIGKGKGDGSFYNRPFVFLNACESSTIGHLLETSNFPEGFLRFRASGVIATACTVPDNFANAFAIEFYRRLLKLKANENDLARASAAQQTASFSSNIGEALLETRVHFLEKFNNPLGLAYGLYALSNQKLRLEG